MRAACKVAAHVLDDMCRLVTPGMNTYDLDQAGRMSMREHGAESACYNYRVGDKVFPAYTCLSVNDEIVHGIGDLKRVLNAGDNIAVDVVVRYKGFIGDNARTVIVGDEATAEMQQLLDVTEKALYQGISKARAGKRVGDISHAIQKYVEGYGYGIVREFVGHGLGRAMHEHPQIPNYGRRGGGAKLYAGMTLAIEPMINLGKSAIKIAPDGWTALTADAKPAAHFEHTVLITDGEAEILTVC